MDTRSLLIAIACGLATAVLFLSPLSVGTLGLFLSPFTATPLFVAALGLGTLAALMSGIVAAIAVAFFTGIYGALAVAVVMMLPAIIVGHFVGLVRHEDGLEEWYPVDRIMALMAIMSAVLVIGIGFAGGYSPETALEQARGVAASMPRPEGVTPEMVEAQAAVLAAALPLMLPASLFLLMVFNLAVGMRIARGQGWVLRPRDDLPATVAIPQWAGWLFLIASAAAFLVPVLRPVGMAFAGALSAALLLVGLATIHFITRGRSGRGFNLAMLYVLLVLPFTSSLVTMIVALGGVAETFFGLRARRAGPPSQT